MSAPPVYKSALQICAESDKTNQFRDLIVSTDMNLFQLHRLLQYSFMQQKTSESTIEALVPEFTYQGRKITALRTHSLDYINKEDMHQMFLWGQEPLKYAAGNVECSISATRCTATKGVSGSGLVDVAYYVPRCIGGSSDADLDEINEILLFTKFLNNHSRNKTAKKAPAVYAPQDVDLMAYHLECMQDPIEMLQG